MIGVFVLKRNGMRPPTPLDQVSSQSDNFCEVFVHMESKSVKTTILIAKLDMVKMSIFVILRKLSKVKAGDDEKTYS